MNSLQQQYKRQGTMQRKRRLAFLSYNLVIAACLLGAVGLSHLQAQHQEEAVRRRAELLVDSVMTNGESLSAPIES